MELKHGALLGSPSYFAARADHLGFWPVEARLEAMLMPHFSLVVLNTYADAILPAGVVNPPGLSLCARTPLVLL